VNFEALRDAGTLGAGVFFQWVKQSEDLQMNITEIVETTMDIFDGEIEGMDNEGVPLSLSSEERRDAYTYEMKRM
jgi:hypothetical protein